MFNISLTKQELAIVLGALLMHWGVPFRSTHKKALTDREQQLVDDVKRQGHAYLDADAAHPSRSPFVLKSTTEHITVLVQVIDRCVDECSSNEIDTRIHLQAESVDDVRRLVARLRDYVGD